MNLGHGSKIPEKSYTKSENFDDTTKFSTENIKKRENKQILKVSS